MNRYTLSWTMTEEEDGSIVRDFLLNKAHLSNRLLIKAKQQDGAILVNGVKRTVRHELKQGEILKVIFPPEEVSSYLQEEDLPLEIIYEDDDILVVNKQAGMPTMPSRTHPHGTLANGVLAYYKRQALPYTIHVVTRLDRDTSGLVLIAKHQYSHSFLSNMQRKNKIERIYHAIVHGEMSRDHGLIDQPIGRHPDSIIERMVTADGQEARTFYQVNRKLGDMTLVHVRLETGRTHQIRVHFASIGHPLLGDTLYGGKLDKIQRQALHCSEIKLLHPFTKKELAFSSPLPSDMITYSESDS